MARRHYCRPAILLIFKDSDVISRKLKPMTDADGKVSFQTDCRLRPVSVSDKVFPGRGRGNDRREEQRNLGYFYCVPGGTDFIWGSAPYYISRGLLGVLHGAIRMVCFFQVAVKWRRHIYMARRHYCRPAILLIFKDSDVISRKLKPMTDADGKVSFQTDCRLRPVSVSDKVFPGRGRGNDRREEQRNLGYFYCVPGGTDFIWGSTSHYSAEDCSVYYTEQSGWLRKDRYK